MVAHRIKMQILTYNNVCDSTQSVYADTLPKHVRRYTL